MLSIVARAIHEDVRNNDDQKLNLSARPDISRSVGFLQECRGCRSAGRWRGAARPRASAHGADLKMSCRSRPATVLRLSRQETFPVGAQVPLNRSHPIKVYIEYTSSSGERQYRARDPLVKNVADSPYGRM
jgi:hypothetical protein